MTKQSAFICHASADKEFARQLCADLRKFGIQVWLDEQEIIVGDSLFESIDDGLRISDYTIVVLSKTALTRPWVKKEIAASFYMEVEANRKKILPALIEDCPVPIFLKDKRYADFRGSYDLGLNDLLKVFRIGSYESSSKDSLTQAGTVCLDIIEPNGSLVKYEKRTTSLCLRDGMDEIVELFTADGKMGDFETIPGEIGETWVESGVTYVKILLPTVLMKGDRIEKVFRMTMYEAFMNDSEYWEGKQNVPADSYALIVKFPHDRSPKRWETYERDASRVIPSVWKAESTTDSGRVVLTHYVEKPELYRNYVLRWWW